MVKAGLCRASRFEDVTKGSGADDDGYGVGVAVGDYDGDGWIDLYVTNLGPNVLLRNRGDGTFEDVSRAGGVDESGFGSSAAFVDIDLDGDLTNGGLALIALGGYSRQLGDSKRTPFTAIRGSADQWMGALGIGYTF